MREAVDVRSGQVESNEDMEEEEDHENLMDATSLSARSNEVVQNEIMETNTEEGNDGKTLLTILHKRKIRIKEKMLLQEKYLQLQVAKLTKLSTKKFQTANVGDNFKVRVPDVDRGKCDARNVLGVITAISEKDLYKIGTKFGAIDTSYSHNQFSTCKEKLICVN